eukprot:761258-Pyramimonas_sp.AAC.1
MGARSSPSLRRGGGGDGGSPLSMRAQNSPCPGRLDITPQRVVHGDSANANEEYTGSFNPPAA